MSVKNAVYNFIAGAYADGSIFTTRDVAKRLSYNAADISAALSSLRINDGVIIRSGVTKDTYGTVMNQYKLNKSAAAVKAGNRFNTFVEAVKAQNGIQSPANTPAAPGTLADKLAALTKEAGLVAPAKALADYSDEELLAELKRRL